MSGFLGRFGSELWMILSETGVWLLLGLALAGVVHVLIPRSLLERHLSGPGVGPILKASLLGIPLPLCSCGVIPVAAGLRASGASKGASAAFAISTPQTGEESVPLTWALFGPVYALARPVLAVATAFAAGLLIERVVGRGEPRGHGATGAHAEHGSSCCGGGEKPREAPPCCGSSGGLSLTVMNEAFTPKPPGDPAPSCCGGGATEPSTGTGRTGGSAPPWLRALVPSLRYGFGTLLRDLAPWLAAGLLLSALVGAAVPPGWIESNVGTGIVPMLLMLVVGLPLYVCATSTTPLAYTLVVAGLSPGAAMVLLLAGPATNAATMSWVVKDLGGRALAVYLATIAVFAVAGGLLFDALLAGAVTLADQAAGGGHAGVNAVQGAAAGGMVVLLLFALAERYAPGRRGQAGTHAGP